MELNVDCVRDTLLTCEELLIMDDLGKMPKIGWHNMKDYLNKYDQATVKYTVKYLKDANMINASIISSGNSDVLSFFINDITPSGHEFLKNVKEDTIWNETKKKALEIGSLSIYTLKTIAESVVAAAIAKSIGL